MSRNGMNRAWRKNRIVKHKNKWHKVPVGTKEDESVRGKNPCVAGALVKFSDFHGLKKQYDKFIRLQTKSSGFGDCVSSWEKCRGFLTVNGTLKNPLDADPELLYLLQISAEYNGNFDNTHCVSLYNNLIFDINHIDPLPLSKTNLDLCCLGDKWKFHHISKCQIFQPHKKTYRFIQKHINNNKC